MAAHKSKTELDGDAPIPDGLYIVTDSLGEELRKSGTFYSKELQRYVFGTRSTDRSRGGRPPHSDRWRTENVTRSELRSVSDDRRTEGKRPSERPA